MFNSISVICLSVRNRASDGISFNKPVSDLAVNISGIAGATTKVGSGEQWNIVFSGLKDATYPVTVVADGMILTVPQIKVLPALGGGDGDLP